MTTRLGVDIGGTGIKAAPVDIDHGVMVGDRLYRATPSPAAPQAVASVVAEMAGISTSQDRSGSDIRVWSSEASPPPPPTSTHPGSGPTRRPLLT